jgi:hypothetical protein
LCRPHTHYNCESNCVHCFEIRKVHCTRRKWLFPWTRSLGRP